MGRPQSSGRRRPEDRAEARRRREEEERLAASARRRRRAIVAGSVAVAVVLVAVTEVFIHRLSGEERSLLAAAPSAATAAGCTAVRDIPPYPGGLDRTHIGASNVPRMPPLSTYRSVPPASGPHAAIPLGAGVYGTPPPLDQAIHSLEHAAVTIWYDPASTGDAELQRIRSFFARGNESNHVIVAPYNYPSGGPAGHLPAGTTMALVAWHRLQTCARPNLAVAFAFVHAYRFNLYQWGAYRGEAPERWAPI